MIAAPRQKTHVAKFPLIAAGLFTLDDLRRIEHAAFVAGYEKRDNEHESRVENWALGGFLFGCVVAGTVAAFLCL